MNSSKKNNEDNLKKAKQKYENIEIPDSLDSTIEKAVEKGERKDIFKYRFPLTAAAFLCIILLALSCFPKLNFLAPASANTEVADNKNASGDITVTAAPLPTVDSFENMKKLLDSTLHLVNDSNKDVVEANGTGSYAIKGDITKSAPLDNNMNNSNVSAKSYSDYSTTNSQVEGVEEGDVVKTDGDFIYKINGSTVQIIRALPATEMKVIKNIRLNNEIRLQELFVDNKTLTVIGTYYKKNDASDTTKDYNIDSKYPINSTPITKVLMYNISDKNSVSELRSFEVSGSYYTARKIDSKIYIISNQFINLYKKNGGEQPILPFYLEDAKKTAYTDITLDKIKYCPNAVAPNYLNISSIDTAIPNSDLEISTYMASAGNIYVSDKNLYVSGYDIAKLNSSPSTTLYKFSLNKGKVQYFSKAEIPGTTLNQFSMDENNGYLRIATTVNGSTSKNNLYVLDNNLSIVGKIENIAPSERIYSTRFMGDRAYMVTFKNTDPLYVIDLKTPESPKILGELKLPGFSTYLHPYDENHIIGFGKDTEEVSQTTSSSNTVTKRVIQKGLKLAIFDVTNVNEPKVMFSTTIGDNGTDSAALYNHKAFLFSKDRQLLAFPLSVNEFDNKVPRNPNDPYGTLKFEGAYVYKVDLETGFTLKNKISNQSYSNKDFKRFTIDFDYSIQRLLYINNSLYSVSNNRISSYNMADYSQVGSLSTEVK